MTINHYGHQSKMLLQKDEIKKMESDNENLVMKNSHQSKMLLQKDEEIKKMESDMQKMLTPQSQQCVIL